MHSPRPGGPEAHEDRYGSTKVLLTQFSQTFSYPLKIQDVVSIVGRDDLITLFLETKQAIDLDTLSASVPAQRAAQAYLLTIQKTLGDEYGGQKLILVDLIKVIIHFCVEYVVFLQQEGQQEIWRKNQEVEQMLAQLLHMSSEEEKTLLKEIRRADMQYMSYKIQQAYGKEVTQPWLREVNYYMIVYLRKFSGDIAKAKAAVLWGSQTRLLADEGLVVAYTGVKKRYNHLFKNDLHNTHAKDLGGYISATEQYIDQHMLYYRKKAQSETFVHPEFPPLVTDKTLPEKYLRKSV